MNTLVVGASAGSAHVFERTATNGWQQVSTLTGASESAFGSSVAISGDYLAVGAPDESAGLGVRPGAARVYERTGASGWQQVARLWGIADGSQFGTSVGIDGDYFVVGWSGVTEVFERGDASRWQSGFAAPAGFSSAISGDHMVVGGLYGTFVYQRTSAGWQQLSSLLPTDAVGGAFGRSVALGGSDIAVGAPREGTGGTDAGACYVF